MKKFYSSKKGMTLAELAVVVAVVGIIATMVVSFTVLVSNKNTISGAKLKAMNELELVEENVEHIITESVAENNRVKSLALDTEAKALIFTYNDDSEYRYPAALECISAVTITDGDIYGEKLYICKVIYSIKQGEELTYTFCVNPYEGESVGE